MFKLLCGVGCLRDLLLHIKSSNGAVNEDISCMLKKYHDSVTVLKENSKMIRHEPDDNLLIMIKLVAGPGLSLYQVFAR